VTVISIQHASRFARVALAALTVVGATTACAAGPTYQRISVADFVKDPKKVASLQKAIAAMRSRNTAPNTTPDYRASWDYWAATHGYFGQGSNASGTAADFIASAPQSCQGLPSKLYQTCLSYYPHSKDLPVPNDGIAPDVWGTCQHSDPQAGPSAANLQFLTWHRMYLHFYERVVRKSSGDPNFALPYWDYYGEPGPGGKGLALPKLVRGSSTGSLYDQFRTPGLNDFTTGISPNSASAVQAFKFTDFHSFSFQLEMQPHGQMHCATGFGCQAPDMGIVPVAGLDPVFYMHHANIDRLWQCWMVRKANGQPITLAWAKANLGMDDSWFAQTFTFADENGNKATMAVQDLFQPAFMDYTYDKLSNCVPGAGPLLLAVERKKPTTAMKSAAPLSLKGIAVSVDLAPSPALVGATLQDSIKNTEPGRVVLILQDIQINGSPGVTYEIRIHKKGAPQNSAYVATLNYFGVLGATHSHKPGAAPRKPGYIKTLFYDVTAEVDKLGLSGDAAKDLSVRFIPTDGTVNAATTSDKAGTVTVGSVRVQDSKPD
jgi:Common central domain of tyrosinase/Polyphenol oxidase middle domain